MTPFELAALAILFGSMSIALFFIINAKVNAMRDILRDYCDRCNTMASEQKETKFVPPTKWVAKWRYEMEKADKGSARWQAYRNKLKEYYLLNDGD
jgi:hypothetical protein